MTVVVARVLRSPVRVSVKSPISSSVGTSGVGAGEGISTSFTVQETKNRVAHSM